MNFEKLKDAARKHEQKEDWRRAIEVYLKAIQEFESGHDPAPDLSIYNRVGDLYLKANEPGAAVQAYERAADLYRDQGFLNNAIALCGKILRVNPGRIQTYLKLAHLHARKNVVIEAKKNLLEYLERMNALNQLDEAFKAMKDFADQFPGNKEIRLMLSELLRASSRNEEAKEQLEKLASDLEARGDTIGARKTLQRLHAIESADTTPGERPVNRSDLIFLDTGLDTPALRPAAPPARPTPPGRTRSTVRTTVPQSKPAATSGLPLLDVGEPLALEPTSLADEVAPQAGTPVAGADAVDQKDLELLSKVGGLTGFEIEPLQIETSSLAGDSLTLQSVQPISDEAQTELTSLEVGQALGFEPTLLGEADLGAVAPLEGLEMDAPPPDSIELKEPVEEGAVAELRIERATSLDLQAQDLDDEDLALTTPSDLIESSLTPLEDESGLADDFSFDLNELPSAPEMRGVEVGLDLDLVGLDGETIPTAATPLLTNVPFLEVAEPKQPTIAELEEKVFDDPDNPDTHRTLGEALLATGEPQRGSDELELAMSAYENREDWQHAIDVVNELIRLEPNGVRHHQKRVELSFRTGDKTRLIDAYVELGDALMRAGALDKALSVYRRVAEHDPGNQRALVALETLSPVEEPPPPPRKTPPPPSKGRPSSGAGKKVERPEPVGTPVFRAFDTSDSEDFIDLGALIREDEERPRDTRMKVGQEEPSGDEQKDFDEMLMQFKRGIDENIDAEDFQSHYDLGVAFKEMGLLDEAISEFQKALRSPEGRLRTSEALGAAFFEKGQFAIAESILKRATDSLGASDEQQIGLIYWLGRATEAQGKIPLAMAAYQRVLAVEISFQDTTARMRQLAAAPPR